MKKQTGKHSEPASSQDDKISQPAIGNSGKDSAISDPEIQAMLAELMLRNRELELQNKELRQMVTTQDGINFEQLVENSPDGVILVTREGKIRYASPAALELSGYSPGNADFTDPGKLFHPEDLPFLQKAFSAIIKVPSDIKIIQYRFRSPDGKWKWIESTMTNMLAKSGLEAIVIYSREINDRKQTEAALKNSEFHIRELIDNVDGSVWAVDRDFRLVTCNAHYQERNLKYLGRRISTGENVIDIPGFESDLRDEWLGYHARVMNGGQFKTERRTGHKNEDRIDEIMFRPIRNPEDEIIGMIVVQRDITDRKKAEETLRNSEEKFRMLLELATDAFFQGDKNGNFITVNNKAVELTGFQREELLQMNIADLFPEKILEKKPLNYNKLQKGHTIKTERIIKRKDQLLITVEMNSRAMPDGTYQSFLRDISERKKAEAELERQRSFFEQMFVQSATSTQILDPDGWCLRVNPKLSGLFGVLPENIEGNFYNIFQDAEIKNKGIDKILNRVYKEHRIEVWEVFFDVGNAADSQGITIDKKKKVWFSNKAYPILDENGNLLNVVIQHEDISDRKRAEEALKLKEEQLLTLINGTRDLICFKDGEGRWIQANNSILALFGLTGVDYFGKRDNQLAGFAHPVYADTFGNSEKSDEIAWQKGVLSNQDEDIPSINGQNLAFETSKTPLFNQDGTRKGLVVFGRDITERKTTEKALKESELKYRQIVEYSPDAIVVHANNHILFANPATLKLLGAESFEQIRNIPLLELIHPESIKKAKQRIDSVMETGIPAGFTEEKFLKLNGDTIDGEVISIPIQYMGKKAIQVIVRDISVRKHALEALKESEDKFRTLAESAPYAIMIYQDDCWVYTNPSGERITGYAAEELYRMKFWEIGTSEYRDIIRGRGKKRQEGLSSTPSYEFKIRTKDGNDLWVYLTGSSLLYKGRMAGIISVINITGRKQAEEAIHRERMLLRTLIDNLPDTIYFKDNNCRKIVANRADLEFLGITEESKALGKTDVELLGEETGLRGYMDDLRVIRTGMPLINSENDVTGTDGKPRWMLTSKIPLHDENGKVSGLVGIGHDITERRYAEKIQQVLFQISNAVLITSDLEQLFLIIREQLSTLLDTTNFFIAFYNEETDTLSTPYFRDEKESVENWPAEKSATGYVIKNKKSLLADKKEIERLCQDGLIEIVGEICQVWLGVPLLIEGKAIGAIVVQSYQNSEVYSRKDVEMLEFVSHQVSLSIQRKKAEMDIRDALAKAEESDRLKTSFLNNMSHEIRTPLNGILGFTSLLNDPDITSEDEQYFCRIINQNGEQLLSIINDIINIATIEAGQEKVREREVNVHEMLELLYGQFKLQSSGKQLMLNYRARISRTGQIIKTDETKLRQILTNLIGNALKFTDQGMVEFGCRQSGSMLEFFVTDTGVGIPPEMHGVIFERFRQANMNPKKEYRGNGLGLAISKAYIELLGGTIWLESTPGKGSTFWFTIPYQPIVKTIEPYSPADIQVPADAGKGKTLLVAEDVYANFQLIEAILKKMEYRIIHVENGKEAVEACRNNPDIDLVLMDMKMPEMDGFEATGIIRQFRPLLPIIAVTAYALGGDKEKTLKAGCDDYIAKPVKANVLVEILNRFLVTSKTKGSK